MSLYDFLRKQPTLVKNHGIRGTIGLSVGEALMKGAKPYARYKSKPIWNDEWDVCLVLDACRYDLWEEVAWMYPYLTPKGSRHDYSEWSVGSASPEWISETFKDEYQEHWENTGYVTANPFSGKRGVELETLNESVYPLCDRGLPYLDEVWRDQWPLSDEIETVDPTVLTERGLWAWENREIDHLIVHYMQPHTPFKKRPEWSDGWNTTGVFGEPNKNDNTKDDWHKVRDGEIPEDEFWNAYAANLEWVLKEVQRWKRFINGRILVTSDHGNAMGEWHQWGHPPNSANPSLRNVPWVLVEGDGSIDPDPEPEGSPPVIGGVEPNSDVEAKLKALGYR